MSKVILTIAFVLTAGVFSLIKTTNAPEKISQAQLEKAAFTNQVAVLATAD